MPHNKKPAVLVAIVLSALIVLPILVLIVSRADGTAPQSPVQQAPSIVERVDSSVDFDLRQLADKAEALLSGDLAAALRQGDVSLDFAAAVERDAESARRALSAGKLDRARDRYTAVVQAVETQLAALSLAEDARSLNDTTYAELQRLEYLKSGYENTYREAVETYNQALRDLAASKFGDSVNGFERSGAILRDLEGRALQQVGSMLEAANAALDNYNLSAARSAYEQVLQLDPGNADAAEGLAMLRGLEGLAEAMQVVDALAADGEFEAALSQLDALLAQHASNPFLLKQRQALAARILERDFNAALEAAAKAEASSDLPAAIAALERAIGIRPSPELSARVQQLQAHVKAARVEALLATGYDALRAGSYEAARTAYQEAQALAPASTEARTGLEKASSLYLANIRYRQSVTTAAKYLKQGRFPLAAKFFNEAMGSRPSQVPPSQLAEESRIRRELAAQSGEVAITIASDKRTYVSLIGVFPPDRFKEKELKLFPDVYKLKGTRKGYQDVEFELKVDARQQSPSLEVICTEKQ
jgi:outer membrane protein assembly factor BamD (BamD/ComL family)